MASVTYAARESQATLIELHLYAIHQILGLVEGIYSNIDHGLLEFADRDPEGFRQEHCSRLIQSMRLGRQTLIRSFSDSMQSLARYWFVDDSWEPVILSHQGQNLGMTSSAYAFNRPGQLAYLTSKSNAHFSGLLRLITERANHATDIQSKSANQLPIGPAAISQSFVLSCRSLRLEDQSIVLILHLFSRFVLDRMGQTYAQCNNQLRDAGYLTIGELEMTADALSTES